MPRRSRRADLPGEQLDEQAPAGAWLAGDPARPAGHPNPTHDERLAWRAVS
ncbi:hypothetical protein [Ancylobacter sp.]|uniref:hypothetical protein n=1 Tax=Ancylobacter sp. TaxID=1872567 RepID=UPI003C7CE1AF